eukprot:TRINITY_DN1953_c0_g1_i1.p1 TRINITY_DN1953_c0_g1~~TRINITY_DN1953_c0_g1_i1.p1  ORF type:complete len:130 (+),score=23.44 TRINITY_DN1953_c0_g1_i1:222-611(+)
MTETTVDSPPIQQAVEVQQQQAIGLQQQDQHYAAQQQQGYAFPPQMVQGGYAYVDPNGYYAAYGGYPGGAAQGVSYPQGAPVYGQNVQEEQQNFQMYPAYAYQYGYGQEYQQQQHARENSPVMKKKFCC